MTSKQIISSAIALLLALPIIASAELLCPESITCKTTDPTSCIPPGWQLSAVPIITQPGRVLPFQMAISQTNSSYPNQTAVCLYANNDGPSYSGSLVTIAPSFGTYGPVTHSGSWSPTDYGYSCGKLGTPPSQCPFEEVVKK